MKRETARPENLVIRRQQQQQQLHAAVAAAAAAAAAAATAAEPAGTPTAARQALGAPAAETSRVLVVLSPCRSNNIVVNYIDSTLMAFVHL